MNQWYTYDTVTKKYLFILMEKAKEPVALKAGPFFRLSFETFVKVSIYDYIHIAEGTKIVFVN